MFDGVCFLLLLYLNVVFRYNVVFLISLVLTFRSDSTWFVHCDDASSIIL